MEVLKRNSVGRSDECEAGDCGCYDECCQCTRKGNKEKIQSEMDEVVESVPKERDGLGDDLSEHVGEGDRSDEEVVGRHESKESNEERLVVKNFS